MGALVTVNNYNCVDLSGLEKKLDIIINQNNIIVGTIQDLQNKLTELETAWSQENQEISDKVTNLQTEIQSLKDIIAAQGNQSAEIDAAIARVDVLIADIKDTVQTDTETPPAEPEPNPEA